MTMTKAFRRLICRLMIGVMLLAQISIAAYACPGLAASMAMQSDLTAMTSDSLPVDMADCDQMAEMPDMATSMDKALPNLCAEHCHQGHQSDQTQVLALPAVALISLYTVDQIVCTSELAWPTLAQYVPLAAAPPPLSILHCCFRT
ncbi:MAG: hypothetical protein KGL57_04180 [Burkholderiales bacterium]|nr:hypothetical protein [Burkholderiales bacterium]